MSLLGEHLNAELTLDPGRVAGFVDSINVLQVE